MTDTTCQRPPHEAVLPTDPAVPNARTYHAVRVLLKSKCLTSATHVTDWELLGGTVMTVDGAAHGALRRLEGTLFRPGTLKWYEKTVLQPAIRSALERAAATSGGNNSVVRTDLVRLGQLIMLSISAAVIGLDDDETPKRRDRPDHLIEGVLVEWSARDHAQVMAEPRAWKQIYGDDFVCPSVERRQALREADPDALGARRDVLAALLTDPVEDWTNERILRNCVLYLVASALATSTARTHTVGHLDSWLRERPDDQTKLGDCDVVRAAAMDSLRLHLGPRIPLRRAESPLDAVVDDIGSSTGQVVVADIREANRDTGVYGPPTEWFEPLRELDKSVPLHRFTFGVGRHQCIGRPLALGNGGRGDENVDGILVRRHDMYERYAIVFRNL